MATEYQGHHCWNCWAVHLWVNNNEDLYLLAVHYLRWKQSKSWRTFYQAARLFRTKLPATTPDGAKYTIVALRTVLEDLDKG